MPPASPRVLVAEAKLAQDLALAGDVDGLVALVTSAHEGGRSYAATFDRVIAPGLEDIGARWACGDLSIPQEHVASLAVADMLARLRPFVEDAGARRGIRRATALCACLGDERHDLALRMVALVLAEQGYQAQVVAPVPTVDLAQLVGASGPGLVALSASSTADPDRLRGDLALLASAASAVRSRVVVGGAGFAMLSRVPGSVIRHAALGELEAELAAAS
jgi:methanogenic corrinoid protein MtbC1